MRTGRTNIAPVALRPRFAPISLRPLDAAGFAYGGVEARGDGACEAVDADDFLGVYCHFAPFLVDVGPGDDELADPVDVLVGEFGERASDGGRDEGHGIHIDQIDEIDGGL